MLPLEHGVHVAAPKSALASESESEPQVSGGDKPVQIVKIDDESETHNFILEHAS